LFDTSLPDAALYDEVAEKQADQFAAMDRRNKIPVSQLRRFFSELKDLYRRQEARQAADASKSPDEIFRTCIEPQFRMIRSKVAYTTGRQGGSSVPREFADFLSLGIKKVSDVSEFRRFVTHVEAVVGFMYGKDAFQK